jgi:hypothetical protein
MSESQKKIGGEWAVRNKNSIFARTPDEKQPPKPKNNKRRFRFIVYVESFLEAHQTRNALYFLSESPFDCRLLRDFHSFHCSHRRMFGKLKKQKRGE